MRTVRPSDMVAMSRTVCKEVYTFDELDESAKEKAREWYREGSLDHEWWDGVYSNAQDAAKYLGVTFDARVRDTHHRFAPVPGQSPKVSYDVCICLRFAEPHRSTNNPT